MPYNSIKITFPTGRVKTYPYSAFDYYATTNELEHKEESIIITLDSITKSFVYETDELSGEMINKEYISIEFAWKSLSETKYEPSTNSGFLIKFNNSENMMLLNVLLLFQI